MRVIFYARPWTVNIFTAIEEWWRRDGTEITALYMTEHLQAHRALQLLRRRSLWLPGAIRAEVVADPVAVLATLEARYRSDGLPFMRYLMSDRFLGRRSRKGQLDQFARYAQYFDHTFAEFRPDRIIGESPDIAAAWLAYSMAPHHGCQAVGLMPSTLPPGRLLMLTSHRDIPGARERYERLKETSLNDDQLAAARRLQDIVLGVGTKLDYLTPRRRWLNFTRRLLDGSVAREQLDFSTWQIRERRAGNPFHERIPVLEAARAPFRSARAAMADRLFLNDPSPEGPFAFFPLHYEPEATTLVHGSYFGNQLETVRNIARSLPIGWTLAVKEHFYMRGLRAPNFYRELRRIPSVRLLPFSVPTNRLISKAAVVVVIASTCGLEAGLIGRPVVVLGDYPWDYAPTISKVGPLSELPDLVLEAAGSALAPDHPRVLAFAASWDAALPAGRYYRHRQSDWLEPDNVAQIAAALSGPVGADRDQAVVSGRAPAH